MGIQTHNPETTPSTDMSVPLCVDLDGTLVRTDTLVESVVLAIVKSPLLALRIPLWLARGKSVLKHELASRVVPDSKVLPYNEPLVAMLRESHAAGRTVVLATAAHEKIARSVADHLQCFTSVLATTQTLNLKGANKAQRLEEEFGAGQFDYVGDAVADIPVWQKAREVHFAEHNAALEQRVQQLGLHVTESWGATRPSRFRLFARMLRLHQWLKNLLVFAPLVASLSVFDLSRVGQSTVAFFLFGLCASSIYIVNDLVDLPSDRRHPRKKLRPFAAGDIPILTGVMLAPLLAAGALATSFATLPMRFSLTLVLYLVMTTWYSFHLKRVVIADVIMLAALYTVRIIAGAFAIGVVPSFWLLAFSMFLFLSLALMKRFTEVYDLAQKDGDRLAGRGYVGSDLRLLGSLGSSAGFCAVLVLALYINSPEVLVQYKTPQALWLLCPLMLYWLGRLWLHTERGRMHDDPVVFASRDRITHLVGLIGAAVLATAATVRLSIA